MKEPKINYYDVCVIGAGASGMMAAITAAKNKASVILVEHTSYLGKKILTTGNGRCNFTNKSQGLQFYRCDTPDFVLSILEQFSYEQTLDFFATIGICAIEKNGYCYPRSMQASAVAKALELECKKYNITIKLDCNMKKISKTSHFLCETDGEDFYARSLILATGGKSYPKTGSDGSGYSLASTFGHTIISPVPALVPCLSTDKNCKIFAGVRCYGTVDFFVEHEKVYTDTGELQFTKEGISGIPIFQGSSYLARACDNGLNCQVVIDFFPDYSIDTLLNELLRRQQYFDSEESIIELFLGMVPEKIGKGLFKRIHLSEHMAIKELKKAMIEKLVHIAKAYVMNIYATKDFEYAQITSGGVDTTEIKTGTLESKKISNLYFAGEIIDVEGICGGYNLQWAWSSGYVAGLQGAKRKDDTNTTN